MFLDTITSTLKAVNEIELLGFSTFAAQKAKAREWRKSPMCTGIKAPKHSIFKAGKACKLSEGVYYVRSNPRPIGEIKHN